MSRVDYAEAVALYRAVLLPKLNTAIGPAELRECIVISGVWRFHVLGAEANPYQLGWKAPENRPPAQQLQGAGERQGFGTAEHLTDYIVLDEDLKSLHGLGRETPSLLDGVKLASGRRSLKQRCAEDVRRRDRVLNGQIDPDTANRRRAPHHRYTRVPAATIGSADPR